MNKKQKLLIEFNDQVYYKLNTLGMNACWSGWKINYAIFYELLNFRESIYDIKG